MERTAFFTSNHSPTDRKEEDTWPMEYLDSEESVQKTFVHFVFFVANGNFGFNLDFSLENWILKPPRPSATPPQEGNCSLKRCAADEIAQLADGRGVTLPPLMELHLFPSRGGVASEPPGAKLDGVVYFLHVFSAPWIVLQIKTTPNGNFGFILTRL